MVNTFSGGGVLEALSLGVLGPPSRPTRLKPPGTVPAPRTGGGDVGLANAPAAPMQISTPTHAATSVGRFISHRSLHFGVTSATRHRPWNHLRNISEWWA